MRCGFRELAICGAPIGRPVHYLVVDRFHLANWHAPGGGRCLHEHLARGGAGAAHGSEEVAHAA